MSGNMIFGGETVDVRNLYDMKDVVYDRSWLRKSGNVPLYYMYRDLHRPEDRETIVKNDLRYDITVIPPKMLGSEFVKTKGHYHQKANSMTYPEMYEVLEGEAHELIQKVDNGKVKHVCLIAAGEGDKIISPPNYGHITINPTDSKLRMANWVCRSFDSIYGPIQKKGGAAWFELAEIAGDGGIIKKWGSTDSRPALKVFFKRNSNYRNVPEIEFFEALGNQPFEGKMYDLIKTPEKLRFLTEPEKNKKIFEKLGYYR